MAIAIIIIGAFGLMISLHKYRSINNPYAIFDILWIAVGAMINAGSKFVYYPSSTALSIVLVGVIAFNLSMFSPRFVLGNIGREEVVASASYEINTSFVYKLSWVVLILSIVSAISSIRAVLSGMDFSAIRVQYYDMSSSENVYMSYLRSYFISPMRYVIIISTIIAFYEKRERRYALLVNTIILVLLQAITSGGRYVLMNTFFMFLCGLLLFSKSLKLDGKQKFIFTVVTLLLMYGIVYLTNDRTSVQTADMTTWERLGNTVYTYFAGSVTYLGKVMEQSPDIVGSTYGMNAIAGFISPIFAVLTFLNILPYPQILNVIGTYATEQLRIGATTYYNAMPTIFGYFYIDGGYIMVFVEAIIFGYICKRLYEGAAQGNLLYISFYILMFVQICNASTRWFLFSSEYCLAFVYLPIVVQKVVRGGYSLLRFVAQKIRETELQLGFTIQQILERLYPNQCSSHEFGGATC